jgi:hypothetical protein
VIQHFRPWYHGNFPTIKTTYGWVMFVWASQGLQMIVACCPAQTLQGLPSSLGLPNISRYGGSTNLGIRRMGWFYDQTWQSICILQDHKSHNSLTSCRLRICLQQWQRAPSNDQGRLWGARYQPGVATMSYSLLILILQHSTDHHRSLHFWSWNARYARFNPILSQ